MRDARFADSWEECAGGLAFSDDTTCVLGSQATCGVSVCSTPGETTCDGDRVESCSGLRTLVPVECSLAGWTCITTSTGAACGTPTGGACTIERCDGDVFVGCVDGHEARLDCSKVLAGGTCTFNSNCAFATQCNPFGITDTVCIDSDQLRVCSLGTPVTLSCKQLGFTGCGVHECY